MSTSTRQIIQGGSKALGQFFQQQRSRFAGAPILLIEGGGGDAHNSSGTCETLAGRQVEFFLAHKLGLRTVVSKGGGGGTSTATANALFYTESILHEQLELAARVGATTVCGVGNRTAIDLAKAVATSSNSNNNDEDGSSSRRRGRASSPMNELILVPNTYYAVLSCAYPYTLSLHSDQDVILANPSTPNVNLLPTTTIAPLETNLFVPNNKDDHQRLLQSMQTALRACLALSLDKDSPMDVSHIHQLLNSIAKHINQQSTTTSKGDSSSATKEEQCHHSGVTARGDTARRVWIWHHCPFSPTCHCRLAPSHRLERLRVYGPPGALLSKN